MSFVLKPWQLLVMIGAGWINRQQQEVIQYLRTENQVLKEAHGKKRIRLNDDQRRRLAVKGKILGPYGQKTPPKHKSRLSLNFRDTPSPPI
jgi:hypothetical protein